MNDSNGTEMIRVGIENTVADWLAQTPVAQFGVEHVVVTLPAPSEFGFARPGLRTLLRVY